MNKNVMQNSSRSIYNNLSSSELSENGGKAETLDSLHSVFTELLCWFSMMELKIELDKVLSRNHQPKNEAYETEHRAYNLL